LSGPGSSAFMKNLRSVRSSFQNRMRSGLHMLNFSAKKEGEAAKPRKRLDKPMVVSGGPTVRNLKCVMCQGYIKIGLEYAKCECGETYHVSCLTRLSYCPVCDRKWPTESIAGITQSNGDMSASPYSKKLKCPSCEKMVSIFDLECTCGAIFVRENDSFLCPECGGRVSLGDMSCPVCGEEFRECDIVRCPSCGRNFDAKEGACECGAFLGDACPECGSKIEGDDSFCGKCGCRIEAL
jgi:hypothetical protein